MPSVSIAGQADRIQPKTMSSFGERVAISTLGTWGDVQPYIALALGLIEKGHDVQLAAPIQFEAMVRDRGVSFAPFPGEFLDLLDKPEAKAAIAGGKGFGAGFKLLKYVRPLGRKLLDAEWEAAKAFKPDILVYHPKCVGAPHMAEALKRPCILASPLPGFTPTSAFPSPIVPFRTLGPLNRLTHILSQRSPNLLFDKLIGLWRSNTLGLPARSNINYRSMLTLYGYSPHVIPVPSDWNENVLVTGYWFLDSPISSKLPDPLSAFLKAGEPPIYIGFGSMPGINPRQMTEIVIEALSRCGKRGILATGGGALNGQGASDQVHVVASAPHDKLFEYVSATVHHGGAGTTGAALRAGKPTTICPFFGDQFFWGRRVTELGVGPMPLNRKSLSPDTLAEAIIAMDAPVMRQRASNLGAAIREEKGIANAVGFITRVLRDGVAKM
jgi:UDP:flavonoid glycosyltransferase YjiC (YdhE family)